MKNITNDRKKLKESIVQSLHPRQADNIEVALTGGMIRKDDRGIVDSFTIEFIKQFKPDFVIIGISAIDEDGCLLDFNYQEVKVAQQILEQARKIILVADSKKLGRRAPIQISHLSDIDIFITNETVPKEIKTLCEQCGVRLIVTSETTKPQNTNIEVLHTQPPREVG